jgi:cytochrome b
MELEMDVNVNEIAQAVNVASKTGESGFVVVAILALFAMMIYMGWRSAKDQKIVTDVHTNTRLEMIDLRKRVSKSEHEEQECITQLREVTVQLQASILELRVYKELKDV